MIRTFLVLAALGPLAASAAQPLKLWHGYRGGEEQAIEHAVAEFTKVTGTQVELLAVPYDALSSKLTSAIPHEAGPDVFIFAHERLRQFHRMKIVAPSSPSLDRSAYIEAALDSLVVDGVLYGYPLSLKCAALYFNTALVKRAPATTATTLFKPAGTMDWPPFVCPAPHATTVPSLLRARL